MSIDFQAHLGAVTRTVTDLERDGAPARSVTLERTYRTSADDLWDAVTNPERIPRWFMPISGELKLGGRYQLEGNAGGTITACDAPLFLSATWEFGGGISWIDVHITPETDTSSRFTLAHICPINDHWDIYGPGAVGVGWDAGLLGLTLHFSQPDAPKLDESVFPFTPEGQAFFTGSSQDWGRVAIAFGDDPAHADLAARRTAAFYTGQPAPEE